jgi:autoinducer 2-degrading protein
MSEYQETRMQVTIVHVHVKSEYIESFIDATRKNHEASVNEAGNVRFDILQSQDDPSRFVLYEAYASDADAAEHKQTSHYMNWRDTVAEWMAEPRLGVNYSCLYPVDPE